MADKDAERISKKQQYHLEDYQDIDGELLHDSYGNRYLVNDDYVKRQRELRTPSTDKQIELDLAKELLASDLHRLTPQQKDVMYYTMQRFTQTEIAAKMNISVGSVKQHLGAARKKLAKIITGTKEILKEGLENGED